MQNKYGCFFTVNKASLLLSILRERDYSRSAHSTEEVSQERRRTSEREEGEERRELRRVRWSAIGGGEAGEKESALDALGGRWHHRLGRPQSSRALASLEA